MEKCNSHDIDMCVTVFLASIPAKFKIGKEKKKIVYRKRKNILVFI
jgi:hypothetical protein